MVWGCRKGLGRSEQRNLQSESQDKSYICVLDGKESACNVGDWVQSLGQEDPLEKRIATHSSILA